MGLDDKGKQILRCGIEMLQVREELLDLNARDKTDAEVRRAARLERRKVESLKEVDMMGGGARWRS